MMMGLLNSLGLKLIFRKEMNRSTIWFLRICKYWALKDSWSIEMIIWCSIWSSVPWNLIKSTILSWWSIANRAEDGNIEWIWKVWSPSQMMWSVLSLLLIRQRVLVLGWVINWKCFHTFRHISAKIVIMISVWVLKRGNWSLLEENLGYLR